MTGTVADLDWPQMTNPRGLNQPPHLHRGDGPVAGCTGTIWAMIQILFVEGPANHDDCHQKSEACNNGSNEQCHGPNLRKDWRDFVT